MAISKDKKVAIVEKVTGAVSGASSVVFVNFHGLSVADTTNLRKKLTGEGIGYTVAKKTLIGRVLDAAGITGEKPVLKGEVALAYGTDLIAPARGVYEFQKKHKKNISIIGGIFEGAYKNQEEMTVIASIPSLQVLRGQFVNLINSPIQGFVMVLDQIAEKRAE